MNLPPTSLPKRAFTLIEIMMALAVFGLVLMAIYASWTLIIRSAKVGLEASARIQRERIALRTIEEALTCVRSFEADRQHYGFVAENNDDGFLSFVARLPESFPRSGRFGDFDVRRVSFSLESGESQSQLVVRQTPVLMEMDEDEKNHPLVLAKGVSKMAFEFWDDRKRDWVSEWTATNQLPKMLKLTLTFHRSNPDNHVSFQPAEEVSRIIQLPSIMVPTAIQRPGQQPGQPPVGNNQGLQPNPNLNQNQRLNMRNQELQR